MPNVTGPRVGFKHAITAAIVGVVLLAIGLAQTSTGRDDTRKLGLAQQSEGFTEMYFARPDAIASLGEYPHPTGRQVPVSFVIHNRTHGTRIYSWAIYVGDGSPSDTGGMTLGSGQQVTTDRKLVLVCGHKPTRTKRFQIRLVLAKPAQSLTFWELCSG